MIASENIWSQLRTSRPRTKMPCMAREMTSRAVRVCSVGVLMRSEENTLYSH